MKIYTCVDCGRRLERRRKSARCKPCWFAHVHAENDALVYAGLVAYKRQTGGMTPTAAELAAAVGAESQYIRKSVRRLAEAGRVQVIEAPNAQWRALVIPGEVWSVANV